MALVKAQCSFSVCSIKIVIIALITGMHSILLLNTITRKIIGPPVIALSFVPETVTSVIIIATTVDVIAAEVDASGVGVGRRVVEIALAVGVVHAAIGRSEVAVAVRMVVAVHPPT